MTRNGTHTYQWDGEERLKSIDNGSITTFIYNALGQVARRVGSGWGPDADYAWDAQGHQLGTFLYGWANQMLWVGDWEFGYYFPGAYFIHRNYVGSNSITTKYDGSVYSNALFYPWGQIEETGDTGMSFYASFMRYEGDLGIYTPVNRSYFPTYGRWPSPDPLGGDITNPQSLNRYAYALNNPTTLIDPLGLGPQNPGDSFCVNNPYKASCGWDVEASSGPPPGSGSFGLDEFDFAAAGLIQTGPLSAALPGCGAEYVTCGQYAFGTVGFDSNGFADLTDVASIASDVLNGDAYDEAPDGVYLFDFGGNLGGAGASGGGFGAACLAPNIAQINRVSDLSVSPSNLVNGPYNFNGGANFDFSAPGASPSELPPGRYPSSFLNFLTGIGRSLHVPAPGGSDPSTYGVAPSGAFTFTTHMDSAYSTWHTPIGAFLHWYIDVRDKGTHRGPC